MKSAELRQLSESELVQKGKELRDELFNARIRRATEQLENTALLGRLKKDIARVETLLSQRRNAAQDPAAESGA
jgi:large subunit ribosomal protein L29